MLIFTQRLENEYELFTTKFPNIVFEEKKIYLEHLTFHHSATMYKTVQVRAKPSKLSNKIATIVYKKSDSIFDTQPKRLRAKLSISQQRVGKTMTSFFRRQSDRGRVFNLLLCFRDLGFSINKFYRRFVTKFAQVAYKMV